MVDKMSEISDSLGETRRGFRRCRWPQVVALLVGGYLVLYGGVRLEGSLTCYENRSSAGPRFQVQYPVDQWTRLDGVMAEESGDPLWMARASVPRLLDGIFWPLRQFEGGIRDALASS